ncbi:MAG: NADH-quinone oxidoreductase subunit L [Planctomycetes bacterium]|nr:NADH-quinone oxidoreductase subunit L [Planctomycetota bacterium]
MTVGTTSVLVWLLPLAAAVVCTRLRSAALAHGFAAVVLAVATALAATMAFAVVGGTPVVGPHLTWLDLGSFTLGVGTYVDGMAAVMAVIVCALATGVLVFNAWYMHDDPQAARFPWQFCLFASAMLGVVLSDNLFLSFCCWELVGLGSYLLIGFWFDKPAAADDPAYQARKGAAARGVLEAQLSPAHAQLKAFVMNRVGDAGFLCGIGALLALSLQLGARGDVLSFANLAALPVADLAKASFLGCSGHALLVLAALGIFCGAVGKSAQFPLHTWLPDAMQGPTTASSIIHAATMVAAGVYLVARCYPLFPPEALAVVGWTGGFTCLLAATIACVQWDLKAVLAYSTVSQLGLMFVGLGAGSAAGGKDAAIAHLFTHAFSKCLLFLCAGAVIHACAGHQDLARLGGLRKRMPVVAYVSLAALLALLGMPLFSGFVSKDAILQVALANAQAAGGLAWGPFVLACSGSLLTAAYMLRWWLRIFGGEERDHDVTHHAHDPATSAKAVLLLLAPMTLALPRTIGHWLPLPHGDAHTPAMVTALALLAVGGGFAVWVFGLAEHSGRDVAAGLAKAAAPVHAACGELWGIDRLWNRLFARGLGCGVAAVVARCDLGSDDRLAGLEDPARSRSLSPSVDGLVDGLAAGCAQVGSSGASLHRGRLGVYLAVGVGVVAVLLLWCGGGF